MYFEVGIKRDNCITFSCMVIEKIQPFYFISVKYQIAKLCKIILILFTVTLCFLMFFHSLIYKISRFLLYHVRFFQKVNMKIEKSNAKDLAESENFIGKTVINILILYFIFTNSIDSCHKVENEYSALSAFLTKDASLLLEVLGDPTLATQFKGTRYTVW